MRYLLIAENCFYEYNKVGYASGCTEAMAVKIITDNSCNLSKDY